MVAYCSSIWLARLSSAACAAATWASACATLRLIVRRVDLDQQASGLDVLIVCHGDGQDFTADAAAQLRGVGTDIGIVGGLDSGAADPVVPTRGCNHDKGRCRSQARNRDGDAPQRRAERKFLRCGGRRLGRRIVVCLGQCSPRPELCQWTVENSKGRCDFSRMAGLAACLSHRPAGTRKSLSFSVPPRKCLDLFGANCVTAGRQSTRQAKAEAMTGSGTDKTKAGKELAGPVVVLVEPQLGENIGMCAPRHGQFRPDAAAPRQAARRLAEYRCPAGGVGRGSHSR